MSLGRIALRVFLFATIVLSITIVGFAVRGALDYAQRTEARSLELARIRLASLQSAELIEERFPAAQAFETKFELLEHSLDAVELREGMYCEFGVFTGTTINYLAEQRAEVTFHGFDSFEGLPEAWRTGFDKGTFAVSGLPWVRENVKLYKGWFNETLPGFAQANPEPVAFLHLDADLYSSTVTVLDELGGRLQPGSVIQFDEYFNYPGWREGEFKAFEEFVRRHDVKFEYLGYCDGDEDAEQVSVRILSIGNPSEPVTAAPVETATTPSEEQPLTSD